MPSYKVQVPNTLIWFNIDPSVEFKHGKVNDIVQIKQAVKTNAKETTGEFKILGVDTEFNRATKIIVLESITKPRTYLTVREGQWQSAHSKVIN